MYYAETVTHELLHQGGVRHPLDPKLPVDVRLEKRRIGYDFDPEFGTFPVDGYFTNENTVKNIRNNVMLDAYVILNYIKVGMSRNFDMSGANQVTKSQLKTVEKNIDNGRVNGEPTLDR